MRGKTKTKCKKAVTAKSPKMSKRGPYRPIESENMKIKPSAAASAHSMELMLSVMSGALSSQGQGANSTGILKMKIKAKLKKDWRAKTMI